MHQEFILQVSSTLDFLYEVSPEKSESFRDDIVKSPMKRTVLSVNLFIVVLVCSCTQEKFYVVGRMHVYAIQKHNDSLYFSTSDSGIYRFSPDNPGVLTHVAGSGNLPIRSIVFSKEGKCYAGSYSSGVRYLSKDTLLPLAQYPWPSWSIKLDTEDKLWLAGLYGIYKPHSDSVVLFNRKEEAHDIALYNNYVAVANRNGIFVFNRDDGALIRKFCQGIVCWTIMRHDSLFIGGGLNVCVIINQDRCSTITFGPKGNVVWSTLMDNAGVLYLATQNGLYRAGRGDQSARCVGFKGTCLKSLAFDNKGRIWVGRFSTKPRKPFLGIHYWLPFGNKKGAY